MPASTNGCRTGEGQDEGEISQFKQIVAEATANHPVDWCVQPVEGRKKRMLIADMDSTIIGQESIDEMAELKGIRPEIAAITERSMRGELEFEFGLRERMRLLRGITEADLQRVLGRLTLNPGARTLVQTMKAHGAHTVLVSGGFTFFTSAVAERAGFAANRGNVLLWDNGRLAGAAEPIQGREAKLAALNEEAAAHGILPAEVIAVGDGANDLAMLKAAGLGVAYRAKPIVAAKADAQSTLHRPYRASLFPGLHARQFRSLTAGCALSPFLHLGHGEKRLRVAGGCAIVTELGEVDAIGSKTRRDRRIHGIGDGESAEQERALRPKAVTALAPDGSNAGDVRLRLIGWDVALDTGMKVHRKLFPKRVKAGMHLRRDRTRNRPGVRVFRPEARLRGDFGEIFADGETIPDRETASPQNRHTGRRRMARDLLRRIRLPQPDLHLAKRNFCNLGRQPRPETP